MSRALAAVFTGLVWFPPLVLAEPFQATGFKVGEVSHDTAIVWTRTTRHEKANGPTGIVPTFVTADGERVMGDGYHKPDKNVDPMSIEYPEGTGFADMRYGAPGVEGKTRVRYRPRGASNWRETEWMKVEPEADFSRQFPLRDLDPGTTYEVQVEAANQGGKKGSVLSGTFKTAPHPTSAKRVVFAVSTGQAFHDQDRKDGFQIYPTMLEKLQPDFFVHTGDIVYYDRMAKNLELAWWHWQRTYSRPTNLAFHQNVTSYFIKDDHDTWTNDCWSTMQTNMGSFTWDQGIRVFKEQVPMGERTWRRFRWGQDLEIWLVEGRDYRSPNTAKDGPNKTIWGKEQLDWFRNTVAESSATFRVLISPTPVVGPDRASKNDNHANSGFVHEGRMLREFLSQQKNMVVVCGDRHWQYHSVDPVTGLREYSCGPASDMHAGGWKQSDLREDFHRFLRVKGGFLSGTVDRSESGTPSLTFRFHGVDGEIHFESEVQAR